MLKLGYYLDHRPTAYNFVAISVVIRIGENHGRTRRCKMQTLLVEMVRQVIRSISPHLRKSIIDALRKLEVEAKETPNAWDNILVGLAKYVVDID